MNRLVLVGVACVLAGMACSKDPVTTIEPEVFSGMMVLDPLFESNPYIYDDDSTGVMLIVEGSFYEVILDDPTDLMLCSSQGTIQGFGSNRVTLSPTEVIGADCDSVHIPKGVFSATFRGDSLYIGPTTINYTVNVGGVPQQDALTFHFKLRQTR